MTCIWYQMKGECYIIQISAWKPSWILQILLQNEFHVFGFPSEKSCKLVVSPCIFYVNILWRTSLARSLRGLCFKPSSTIRASRVTSVSQRLGSSSNYHSCNSIDWTHCGLSKCLPSWWRHQMEPFSALLAICAGNSPVPGEFPTQRPVTRSFDIYFDLHPNKRLSKQSWGWWFETISWSLWRHCNDNSRTLSQDFMWPSCFYYFWVAISPHVAT